MNIETNQPIQLELPPFSFEQVKNEPPFVAEIQMTEVRTEVQTTTSDIWSFFIEVMYTSQKFTKCTLTNVVIN